MGEQGAAVPPGTAAGLVTPSGRPDDSAARSLQGVAVAAHVAERVLGLLLLVVGAQLSSASAHHALTRWDAKWYARIAEDGYGYVGIAPDGRRLADYAFFPLFPALERAVAALTGLAAADAGLVISAASSVVAAAGIYQVGARLHDPRTGVVLACLWSSVPVALVTSMAYTEALFTALAAWCLVAVLADRLVLAAWLAVLAGLTRPLGVAVVAAVLAAALVSAARPADGRRRRAPAGPVLAAAVAPLGLVGYLAFVRWDGEGPRSYTRVTKGWDNHVDGGRAFAAWVWELVTTRPAVGALLVAGLVLLAAAVWHTRRYPWPVIAFTLVGVLVSFSTSHYFGSRPRYLLPVFTLLLWPSTGLARLRLPPLVLTLLLVSRVVGRRLRGAAVAGALLVLLAAYAQLALGRHHPSDLLAGWLLAVALVAGTAAVRQGGPEPSSQTAP